jgi:hypothetical protein
VQVKKTWFLPIGKKGFAHRGDIAPRGELTPRGEERGNNSPRDSSGGTIHSALEYSILRKDEAETALKNAATWRPIR